MGNFSQRAAFDEELTIAASTFDGTSKLIGTLTNNPVILLIKNDTDQSVFFADNNGSTNGTTMIAGERMVIDSRANHGVADNFCFPIGTNFYATGSAGTGNFRIGVIYAR